ncbi:MAG: type II secretion system protein GspE [Candidatus Abyssobacteria bacterium SURF_5]|uniref:Type II secretion system protein GspE n=1 Tax=Abyssobacteria bacterium (strain SURF_5) TaxID=2093360 RepID=A0A3A4N6P9_ABYX5|nr:MAG: type II secretion system protein GspE [Candidatus Abyssubacteria bacterium SURF_5]
MQMRLGELLVRHQLITEEELRSALENQKSNRRRLGEILLECEKVSRVDLLKVLALQLEILFLDLEKTEIDVEVVKLFPAKSASKYCCLPIRKEAKKLLVAMADPLNLQAIDDLNLITKCEIKPAVADPKQIQAAIKKIHSKKKVADLEISTPELEVLFQIVHQNDMENGQDLSVADLKMQSEQAPIISIVNVVIHEAIQERASDIHIEPQADSLIVRQRVDGVLYEKHQLPQWIHPAVVSRVKIMANMDIAEKRIPQDGKIRIFVNSLYYDLRISTMPTIFGEKVVIRILNRKETHVRLVDLGLDEGKVGKMRGLNARKQGLILMTGPTGSGKSTTLNAILHELRSPEVNIVTVEDPVEYDIPKTNQVQINPKAGLTFPAALRSILRQDPDIIMVGEIRDMETAEIGIRAAMTGHLVLSTLHTNDAVSAVSRLLNLGIPGFLISSTLLYVLAQRLVRKLCPDCTVEYEPTPSQLHEIQRLVTEPRKLPWRRGEGCPKCRQKGFQGRVAVGEIFVVDDEIRKSIEMLEPESTLLEIAFKNGMNSLLADFLEKVKAGVTAMTEIWNVVVSQDSGSLVCPACGWRIERSYAACPSCGSLLKAKCHACNQIIDSSWRFCPFCQHEQEPKHAPVPANLIVSG